MGTTKDQQSSAGTSIVQENDAPKETDMPILLWLLGIPIPIIILLILFWH
ncbi:MULTISPECIES: hypothetical protein [unclassified Sphingomonas]|nr:MULTISPECIES: hypothetical protein [unclassified Sphingomonas]